MLPLAVSEHYRAQQRLIVATLGLTRREWASMGADFDASWAKVGPRLVLLTASAQLGAARAGALSVPATLAELGQDVAPLAEVNARGFAGVASDGRPLDSLLYGAVTQAKTAAVTDPSTALAKGGAWLDMAVHTMVADAGRGASGVAIAARPKVGYIRMVNPPCCSRCAILAGKWFKWNEGFKRHPRCDCTHVSVKEDTPAGLIGAPDDLFRNGQVKGLTEGQRKAVADGADPSQVINADRRVFVGGKFVSSSSGMTTTEGTTRRGVAGARMGATKGKRAARLTPDAIYRLASDRTEALALLQRHGYVL